MIMRKLYGRASFLFWQYPILWLPVLAADVLTFALKTLQQAASRAIMQALGPHSLFGGNSDSLTPFSESMPRIVALTGATHWITYFVCIALYCAAFGVTSGLVRSRLVSPENQGINGGLLQQHSLGQLTFFSAKMFGLVIIAGIAFVPISFIFQHYPDGFFISPGTFGYIIGVLMMMAIAYFATPMAIRWISELGEMPVGVDRVRRAQVIAVLAMMVSGILSWAAGWMDASIVSRSTPYAGVLVVQAVSSLISAVPYILLFIVLTLSAISGSEDLRLDLELAPSEDSLG